MQKINYKLPHRIKKLLTTVDNEPNFRGTGYQKNKAVEITKSTALRTNFYLVY